MKDARNGSGATVVPMLDPEVVCHIRLPRQRGWGTKRIAAEVGLTCNSVKRYLRGGAAAGSKCGPARGR